MVLFKKINIFAHITKNMKNKVKNNTKPEQPDIEYLVLKNFIAVIKKHGMYQMFRSVVGGNTKNVVSMMYGKMNSFHSIIHNQSKENIFKDAPNIETFVKMMKDSFNGGLNRGEQDPAKLQHHIANCTNMLIHVFIERNVRDFNKLEQLGGEVFESSCREYFGGEFQDMLPAPPENMDKMRKLNQMIIDGGMSRPTPEMMEEIRRIIENSNQEHHSIYGDPGEYTPMVDQEDLDFLDDFLREPEENEEWIDGDEELDDDMWEEDDWRD